MKRPKLSAHATIAPPSKTLRGLLGSFSGRYDIFQQAGSRYRSDPVRYMRDQGRLARNTCQIHIADQTMFGPRDPHINENAALPDMLCLDQSRHSGGGHDSVSLGCMCRQVAARLMADSDGC